MDWYRGIRAVIRTIVIPVGVMVGGLLLLAGCNGVATPTPSDGARGHSEPPPSIATAIAEAEVATVNALSATGIDYNHCGRMCTENFWRTATPADVQAELDKGASVGANYWGVTPLHLAAMYGKWPAMAALLDAGADIDAVDDHNGATPLVYALLFSQPQPYLDTIALLLERGADPNAQREYHQDAPLHITGDPVIAALLIAHGADVNAKNKDGETPLHITGDPMIAALLIAYGADVNDVSTSSRWTPLHNAAYHIRDAAIVKDLLERGADINARTDADETACVLVRAEIRKWQPLDPPPDIDEIRDLVCP